jgi:hypothetical protein
MARVHGHGEESLYNVIFLHFYFKSQQPLLQEASRNVVSIRHAAAVRAEMLPKPSMRLHLEQQY